MLEGQVVESLPLDYSLSFQLDMDVISTKQFSNGSPYILFKAFIIEKVVTLYFMSVAVLLSRYPICFFDLKIHSSQFRQLLQKKTQNN